MVGISRWAGQGSYRTVQRFFSQALPWAMLFWMFFRQHVYRSDEVFTCQRGRRSRSHQSGETHPWPGPVLFPVCMHKPVPGLPSSRYPWSASSNGARSRFTSSRSCAVTQKRRPARPKRTPRSRGPSTAQRRPGRPKGSKNTPKSRGAPSRRSCASPACSEPVAGDRRGDLADLFGARRALRQPPRSADGATEESASDFPLAMRCRSVLPLRRLLWMGGGPIANMAARWITTTYQGNTSKRLRWRDTSQTPPVPGATAPQRVHTAVECRHPCQDSTCAPRPVPMSSCSAVTWHQSTRHLWTTIACGSKSNLTSGMAKQYWGAGRFHAGHTNRGHQMCGEPLVVHGQCGVPSPGGRAAACPGLQCSGLESRLSRPQIRGRDDKNASGKAGAGFIGTDSQQGGLLSRIHPAQPSSHFS